jgi:hypothetical protein
LPTFTLTYTDEAEEQLAALEKDKNSQKICKAVEKTLGLMESNIRHPSLQTHKNQSMSRIFGQDVFEAYAQNKTPAAFRIFWCYGPNHGQITVLSITQHP